jgi:hypothetical protein
MHAPKVKSAHEGYGALPRRGPPQAARANNGTVSCTGVGTLGRSARSGGGGGASGGGTCCRPCRCGRRAGRCRRCSRATSPGPTPPAITDISIHPSIHLLPICIVFYTPPGRYYYCGIFSQLPVLIFHSEEGPLQPSSHTPTHPMSTPPQSCFQTLPCI